MKRGLFLFLVIGTLILLTLSRPVLAGTASLDLLVARSDLQITKTLTPVADAYVDSSRPTVNYGTLKRLLVDGSPVVRSYVRFAVSGLTGAVTKATLRLYANSSLSTGITAVRVADNEWGETSITYRDAPAIASPINTSAPVRARSWMAIDVTPYVTGNGTFSLALVSTNASALNLDSRESKNEPQLVIETSAQPTATTTRSATATATRTLLPTVTPTLIGLITPTPVLNNSYKLIGWNDLGMHCMNQNFGNLAVLPPFNTLWAQLIKPGPEPQLVTQNVTVSYSIEDNTYSAGKTDFWTYAPKLFPGNPYVTQPNVGLDGAKLSGNMNPQTDGFSIVGVPLTPFSDSAPQPTMANLKPYQLAKLIAKDSSGNVLAQTEAVAPVSTEMNCALCHSDGQREGIATGNVETNILTYHDRESGTDLMNSRPVLCASCHSDNALSLPGKPGVPSLSQAMHEKHAEVTSNCYNCHPGQQTKCLRDVMYTNGETCTNCHGSMSQIASTSRNPWVDEPKCETCHGSNYAVNPGLRYRDSKGHGGLYCEACHGSPHAIWPTIQPNDNIQSISLQGHAGTIDDCMVCHTTKPTGPGPHGLMAK